MDGNAPPASNLMALTVDIVSAYVSKNSVQTSELANLLNLIHDALRGLGAPPASEPVKLTPPVSIKKSVTPDYLISLENGRQYKSLKRHLSGRSLTPEQYRTKWGLPKDYPMVAANYAAARSELAKSIGLGQRRARAAVEKRGAAEAKVTGPKKGPGRPRKGQN